MSSGPENKFRKKFCEGVKGAFGRRSYIQKNHGNAFSSGLVDCEFVLSGRVGFFELKACDGLEWDPSTVTKLQQHTLRQLEEAGANAGVLVYFKTNDAVASFPCPAVLDCCRDATARVLGMERRLHILHLPQPARWIHMDMLFAGEETCQRVRHLLYMDGV